MEHTGCGRSGIAGHQKMKRSCDESPTDPEDKVGDEMTKHT